MFELLKRPDYNDDFVPTTEPMTSTVPAHVNQITKRPRDDRDGCPSNRCSGSKLISLWQELELYSRSKLYFFLSLRC